MSPEPDRRSLIEYKKFKLFDRNLTIEVATNGKKVSIRERLADPDHYAGPLEFDNVVGLGDLIVNFGMRASRVTGAEKWSQGNPPPKGIEILEFEDPKIKKITQTVSEIVFMCSYKDPDACVLYYDSVKQIFASMRNSTGVDPKSTVFLGLLRAGGVAGEMLGIPLEEQVLIETKRLRLKDGDGGHVAIGIDYKNRDDLKRMDGKHWLIADPAGATFASAIANLTLAIENGVHPAKVLIWNTVASHKGAVFALEAMRQMGIDGEIVAGGYAPGMNDKYYLETSEGKPSVGDAGDWLSSFLNLDPIIFPKA